MKREYKKLAVHNSVCNEIYFKFQDCLQDRPFGKWLGQCTSFGKELEECVQKNREIMRERNRKISEAKYNRRKEGDYSDHTNKL